MLTTFVSESWPSLTEIWTRYGLGPPCAELGVHVKTALVPFCWGVKVAPEGKLLTEKLSGGGLSTSVAVTGKLIGVPSFTVIGPGTVRTGGSFTAVTVMETVAESLFKAPSVTMKVKLSEPL